MDTLKESSSLSSIPKLEVHTTRINEKTNPEEGYAYAVRVKLAQKLLALEFNNKLILVKTKKENEPTKAGLIIEFISMY